MLKRISQTQVQEIKEITKTDFTGNSYTILKEGDIWTIETIQQEIDSLVERKEKLVARLAEARTLKTQIQNLLTN
jgi:hypothetical protein